MASTPSVNPDAIQGYIPMDRDLYLYLGPRTRHETFDVAMKYIIGRYPSAYAEGSCGMQRTWFCKDLDGGATLIAHSWPTKTSGAHRYIAYFVRCRPLA